MTWLRNVHLRAIVIGLIYFVLMRLSLLAVVMPENVSVLWLPSGYLAATLLLIPRRRWAITLAWVGALHLVAEFGETGNLILSAGYTLANGLEVLSAALIYQWATKGLTRLESVRGVIALPLLGVGSVSSATLAAAVSVGAGGAATYSAVWSSWVMSSFNSMILFAPALLVLSTRPDIRWRGSAIAEAVVLLLLLLSSAAILFGSGEDSTLFLYLPYPLIIWAALRFRTHGAVIAALVLVAVAVAFTLLGRGTMADMLGNPMRLLWLQAYLGGAMMTGLVVATAIFEREHAEGQVRESERARHLLAAATAQSDDGIAILTEDWRIVYLNASYEALVDSTNERSLDLDLRTLPGSEGIPWEEVSESVRRGETWRGTVASSQSHESILVAPIRESGTVVTHYVVFREDVTEEFRLAAALSQAQKMEAIGTLAGGIAHDFNNLLTAILGSLGLVGSQIGPDAAIDVATEAAMEAATLTRKLLTLGRRADPRPGKCDVNATAEKAVRLLFTEGDSISVELDLDPAAPVISADQGQLTQALLNLLINARDSMPTGGRLTVSSCLRTPEDSEFSVHPEATNGRYIAIRVADTGTGMSQAVMEKIFEPFYTTKSTGEGTGLGLAMVYAFAQAHRGWIGVSSVVGEGTQFELLLPAVHHITTACAQEPIHRQKVSILLVDDTAVVLEAVRDSLTDEGYSVLVASSGNAALALFEQRREDIDIVVTDLSMPDGDGHALLRGLRAEGATIPVILMSGYPYVDGTPTGGFTDFLAKPFSPTALNSAIANALNSSLAETG